MVTNARSGADATMQTLRKFRSRPLALWRGYGALTTRNLPHTAMQFPLFERFKAAISDANDARKKRTGRENERMTLLERGAITATAAGTAGAISAVITTPIDVVKTRIMLAAATTFASQQTEGASSSATAGNAPVDATGRSSAKAASAPAPKLSSMAIAREIVAQQGWKGLFRGGALRGVWTMLGSGLYLGVYESGRLYLAGRRDASYAADEE